MAHKESSTDEPPSISYIEGLRTDLVGDKDWTRQKEKDRRHHELYHGEHSVETLKRTDAMLVDPTSHVIKSNYARRLVDRMTGLKLVHPKYSMIPRGLGAAAREHADKLEAWQNEIGPQLEFEQGEDLNFCLTSEVDLIGYSGVAVYFDKTRWSKYPRLNGGQSQEYNRSVQEFAEYGPIPITERHIPAMTWWPLLDGRDVVESIEKYEIAVAVARKRLPKLIPALADRKPNEKIELVRYVNDTWCADYAFNVGGAAPVISEAAYSWQHKMLVEAGKAPVVLYEGLTSADRRPGYRWSSILESIYDVLKTQDFLMTRQRMMVAAFYMVTIIETVETVAALDPTGANMVDREFLLGAANQIAAGRTVDLLKMPQELPDARNLWEACKEAVDNVLPPVLQGVIPGETSGYLFNMAREAAMAAQGPVQDRLARGDAERGRLRWLAIGAGTEIMGQPIKIYTRRKTGKGTEPLGLGYDDVEADGALLGARRSAQVTTDKLANLQAAKEAYDFGFSWNRAVDMYVPEVDDPETAKVERMAEDFEKSPEMVAKRTEQIARRLQLITDEEDSISPEDAATQAGQMPPGMAEALGLTPPALPPVPAGIAPVDLAGRLLALQGSGGPPVEGAPGVPLEQQVAPPVEPPPEPGPATPRRNPRAGQRSQPGGPRKKSKSVRIQGESQ